MSISKHRSNGPKEEALAQVSPFDSIASEGDVRETEARNQQLKQETVDSYVDRLKESANVVKDGRRGDPEEVLKILKELKQVHGPEVLTALTDKYNLTKDILDSATQNDGGVHPSGFSRLDYLKIGKEIAQTPAAQAKLVSTIVLIDFDKATDLSKSNAANVLDEILDGKNYNAVRDAYDIQNPGHHMGNDIEAAFPETFKRIKAEIERYEGVPETEEKAELMQTLRENAQKIRQLEEKVRELEDKKHQDPADPNAGFYDGTEIPGTTHRRRYSYTPHTVKTSARTVEPPPSVPEIRDYSPSEGDLSWVKSLEVLRFLSNGDNYEKYIHLFETGRMDKYGNPQYVGQNSRDFSTGAMVQNLRFRDLLDDGTDKGIKLSDNFEEHLRLRAENVPMHIPEDQRMNSAYVPQAEYDTWRNNRRSQMAAERAIDEARRAIAAREEREARNAEVRAAADRYVEISRKNGKRISPTVEAAYNYRHRAEFEAEIAAQPGTSTYIESPEMVKRYSQADLAAIGKFGSPAQKQAVKAAQATYMNAEEYGEALRLVDPEQSAEIDRRAEEVVTSIVNPEAGRAPSELDMVRDENLLKQAREYMKGGNEEMFHSFLDRLQKDESVSRETIEKMKQIGAQFGDRTAGIQPDYQHIASALFSEYSNLLSAGEASREQLGLLSKRTSMLPPSVKVELNRQFAVANRRMSEGREFSSHSMAAFDRFYRDLNSNYSLAV